MKLGLHKDIVSTIALCVSATALLVSALSFWFSWGAQYHTQIVEFEQRRQEVRQFLFEGQLLLGEINDEFNREWFRNSKIMHDKTIAEIAVTRHQLENISKGFDRIPASPDTQASLDLEQSRGATIRIKTKLQEQLKGVRDANKTIEEIRRGTSK